MQYFAIGIASLLLIILFLIFPSMRRHKDRKAMKGLLIAHRGLHNAKKGIPENSLAAFAEATARGYAIENDIHITKDGKVVVFHDNTLERMCGVKVRIEDLTLEEIKKYRLLDTEEKIPTLKECLDLVDGRVPLLIEFKCDLKNYKELCASADKILSQYGGKYFIQSFFPGAPYWYRKNRKDIMRGQLSSTFGKKTFGFLLTGFVLNFFARPDFVAFDYNHKNNICFRLQKLLGAFPVVWTLRKQEQLAEGQKTFEAYIFENFIPDE